MLKFDKEIVNGDGSFLKLKDGESVVGVLCGEVKEFYVLWSGNKSAPCEENTPGAKFRFKVNFAVIDKTGAITPRILEQGPQMYKAFKELTEHYNLEETVLSIKRTGTGANDTKYAVLPLPKKPSDKTLATIKSLELLPLDVKEDAQAGSESDEVLPF